MAKTTVNTLAIDIQKILDEYEGDARNLAKETVKKVAKKGVEALKSASGVFGGTGKYKSGWTSKIEETRLSVKATLYNAKEPGLVHLLEYGHAKRGGGRVAGRPHVKPVEEELAKVFEEELENAL